MTRSVLLLGESDVGKSHFGAQLLGRLNQEAGALRMVGAAPTLQPFEAVVASLNRGLSAPHTSRDLYVESCWPVGDRDGNRMDLVWPDYGGEQLSTIKTDRRLPRAWTERVNSASGWIVMVRIGNAQLSDDVFSRPLGSACGDVVSESTFSISQQAGIVDLLQWLMFVRRTGSLTRVREPTLMLLLSCWDELPPAQIGSPPRQVLLSRLPMVSAFVEANWSPGSLHVIGLSALGKSLSDQVADEGYIDRGPESFGYVVLEDGRQDPDLTLTVRAFT